MHMHMHMHMYMHMHMHMHMHMYMHMHMSHVHVHVHVRSAVAVPRRAVCPGVWHYYACAVRVPASGVPYVPRTAYRYRGTTDGL